MLYAAAFACYIQDYIFSPQKKVYFLFLLYAPVAK